MSGAGTLPFGLPPVSLGTWQLRGREASRAVQQALALGYRCVDTATGYDNEQDVGAGIRASGVERDDLLIVTKFPEEDAGRERETLLRSLDLLGVDHLDLWLIHGPLDPDGSLAVWERFVDAREAGLVRAIGVSNFRPAQVDDLVARSGVTPSVNQVAFGPRWFDPALLRHHAALGVAVQGHSPFSENDLGHPVLKAVAGHRGRGVHQILLRWHLEHGVPAVAKAASPAHLTANLTAGEFALTSAEVAAIDRIADDAWTGAAP
ncbi:aldo/keto reductase [Streptomyces glycanivorans]|uniref:Aldo/keto reductase n=1 Tax=Streptomyces glycanivorans TaxID=3033808 RepID=A0ABY9JJD9_9ACTN|nr:aldo/keto reductase [Streptomyces sp. Alt3]WLQ67830.1 aldo/keto reductase [Streptomyces sp. Alt3]